MKKYKVNKQNEMVSARPIYVVLKNDPSKRLMDMDIVAMSYDFMELQEIKGVLTIITE